MKKLEIVIKPERLEDLKEILNTCDVQGMMITNIMGYGNQKGYQKSYRGT
ncbi:MAG TPA: transcriptional regulator, partial [Acetobacterium sp.]|nr:transcriptional regulator [Acetobacterium sp.]